jgi:hypothetical protein
MQMTNVTLAIGGRSLTISVAAGRKPTPKCWAA